MKSFLEKFFTIEGILFGIIGILFLFNPFKTLVNFINICGILIIIAGVSTLIAEFAGPNNTFLLISGLLSIICGLVLCFAPIDTMNTIAKLVGIFATVRGIYLIFMSIKYKDLGFNFSTAYNIILTLLGILIIFNPFLAVLSTPYIIGAYFILTAIGEIYLGFKI